jgi:hypothetical protein
MDAERVILTLRPEAGSWQAPPMRRLARLLKVMLRGYGWRCVNIHTEQAEGSQAGPPPVVRRLP